MKSIWIEFFQDTNGAGSMTRLIMFLTFIIAAILVLWLTAQGKMSELYFGGFLAIPTTAYTLSKNQDCKTAIAAAVAAGPAAPAPPAPPIPTP